MHFGAFMPVLGRLNLYCVLSLCLFAGAARSATFEPQQGGCSILLRGPIVDGDAARLSTQLSALPTAGRVTLCLDSPGGDYLEGVRLVRAILAARQTIATRVERGRRCLSSCALVFLAGHASKSFDRPAREVDARAQLGFHGPYVEEPGLKGDERLRAVAYQAGVLAIGELLALPETALFPERLMRDALDKAPDEFYLINTVERAAKAMIDVTGTVVPSPLLKRDLHQVCVNETLWRAGWDAEKLTSNDRSRVPFKNNVARVKFTGFGDEASIDCVVDVHDVGPQDLRIGLNWQGTMSDRPLGAVASQLRGIDPRGASRRPLWMLHPWQKTFEQIAAP